MYERRGVKALLLVATKDSEASALAAELSGMDGVVHLARATGEHPIVLLVHLGSPAELVVLEERLRADPAVSGVRSMPFDEAAEEGDSPAPTPTGDPSLRSWRRALEELGLRLG